MFRRKGSKGFTLIELLVVIAIIGILAAIIAPNAFKAIEKSKVAAVESDYKAVKSATLMYYSDVGAWPKARNSFNDSITPDETASFVTGEGAPNGWDGPYLEKWPSKNPWGGIYALVSHDFDTATTTEYYLSLGANNVRSSSADKVQNDLGDDQVDVSASGGTSELYFKIGLNQ